MPVIHKIRILHKDIYCISSKLGKRDKLGLHSTIENTSIKMLSLAVESAFKSKSLKFTSLEKLRIETEILKHLVRTEEELGIINIESYSRLVDQLVEISKMINGWINYITQKESH